MTYREDFSPAFEGWVREGRGFPSTISDEILASFRSREEFFLLRGPLRDQEVWVPFPNWLLDLLRDLKWELTLERYQDYVFRHARLVPEVIILEELYTVTWFEGWRIATCRFSGGFLLISAKFYIPNTNATCHVEIGCTRERTEELRVHVWEPGEDGINNKYCQDVTGALPWQIRREIENVSLGETGK